MVVIYTIQKASAEGIIITMSILFIQRSNKPKHLLTGVYILPNLLNFFPPAAQPRAEFLPHTFMTPIP